MFINFLNDLWLKIQAFLIVHETLREVLIILLMIVVFLVFLVLIMWAHDDMNQNFSTPEFSGCLKELFVYFEALVESSGTGAFFIVEVQKNGDYLQFTYNKEKEEFMPNFPMFFEKGKISRQKEQYPILTSILKVKQTRKRIKTGDGSFMLTNPVIR